MQPGKQGKRVLMTGIRKGGAADYRLTLFGDAASRFPPLVVDMSLRELGQWLGDLRHVPMPDPTDQVEDSTDGAAPAGDAAVLGDAADDRTEPACTEPACTEAVRTRDSRRRSHLRVVG